MTHDAVVKIMAGLVRTAQQSPDPSTQNAAVLVRGLSLIPQTLAVNEFPAGVEYSDERWVRPTKYAFVEHAERNSVYAAARNGLKTEGLTMVAVWAACADCARAIAQAGISRLVRYTSQSDHLHWEKSNSLADLILSEAGVDVITLTEPIDGCEPILRNGEPWFPNGE